MEPRTNEGIEVKVGQLWQDPRSGPNSRPYRVTNVEGNLAEFQLEAPGSSITHATYARIERMENTGWKLIKDA